MPLEALYIAAAVITLIEWTTGIGRRLIRRLRRRREDSTSNGSELVLAVAEFGGAAVRAHARLLMLARLRASWMPTSQSTAARFSDSLLSDTAPLITFRSRLRLDGDEATNRAADDVLQVLDETAGLLSERRAVIRCTSLEDREEALHDAVNRLEEAATGKNDAGES